MCCTEKQRCRCRKINIEFFGVYTRFSLLKVELNIDNNRLLFVFQRSHMEALQSDSNITWVCHWASDTSESNGVLFWNVWDFLSHLRITAMFGRYHLNDLLSTCATSACDSPLLELCTWILHTSDRVPSQPLHVFSLQHNGEPNAAISETFSGPPPGEVNHC